jgi:hypothetical protein
LVSLYFPAAEVGLPEGCENSDLIPSMSLVYNFYNAMKLFREQVSRYIREQAPQVSCIIGGMCCVWAADVAEELGVPCFIFHGLDPLLSSVVRSYTKPRHMKSQPPLQSCSLY